MEKDAQAKLLEIATPLFAQKGFAAVSIRELAQSAEVNSALISYYFGSKEGLYQAVLEQQFAPIGLLLKQVGETPPASPKERLALYAKGVAAVHRQSPYLIRLMTSEIANPTGCFEDVIKKYISQIFHFIAAALQEGINQGIFKEDLNVQYAAISLAGIMNFFFIAKPVFNSFAPVAGQADDEYVVQAVDTFLHGIIRREGHE